MVKKTSKSIRPNGHWFGIALIEPKDINNFGSICRLCVNYNASMLILVKPRFRIKRALTDTYYCAHQLPVMILDELPIFQDVTHVYFDFSENSTPLFQFEHPKRALYILGGEDRTLEIPEGKKAVYVPTIGCLNLAIATGTLLYDRFLKLSNR